MRVLSSGKRATVSVVSVIVFALGLNCARVGLISEKYPEHFYKVPNLLLEKPIGSNVTFIAYSDNQPGWRVADVFWNQAKWTSWKMLLLPFYQLYLVGNGVVGVVNWFRRTPDYGGRERRLVRDAIYVEAKRSNAAFILNVGDIGTHDGRRPAHWGTFIEENKIKHPLLNEIPYIPVIGNHEHANDTTYGFANFQAIFNYPRFHTVECGDAVLIIVDSNFIIDQYQDIDDDFQDELFRKWFVSEHATKDSSWLEQQLAAHNKKFKIVALHNPLLSYGYHHRDWIDPGNGRDLLKKRRELLSTLEKYDVDLVFSGHDHLYQHSVMKYNEDHEMHFLVGGGGGSPLREVTDTKTLIKYQQQFASEGLNVSLIKMAEIFHYWVVKVKPSELTVKVIEVTRDEESPTRLVEEIKIQKSAL